MREIDVKVIAVALRECLVQANFELGAKERAALSAARESETSETGRAILDDIKSNWEIAVTDKRPLCQDTGVVIIFMAIGMEVRLVGGDLETTLNQVVGETYRANYLRTSIVRHPLDRVNTGDNTPAIIHTRLVPGDRVHLQCDIKGGGSENMSALKMLPPSAGRAGVIDFVVQAVRDAGGNPCPPVIVGVGLGGNFERVAYLAKQALLRPLGEPAANPIDAELEAELLEKINATGVGPMGLGGINTALAVHVLSHPCHIAALPVAVNLDCHSHRHAGCTL